MIKALDLSMVADRAGETRVQLCPPVVHNGQSSYCFTLGVVAFAWSLRARAAVVR